MDPSSFSAFTVIQQTLLSDHNQINIYIKTHQTLTQNIPKTCKMYQIHPGYRWASDSTEKIIQALNSEEIKQHLLTKNLKQLKMVLIWL